jgi:hypothetical protein
MPPTARYASSTERHRIQLVEDADNVRISEGVVFVGYGSGAIASIDPASRKVTTNLPLRAHPEGFQVDAARAQVFVNVPDSQEMVALDVKMGKSLGSWKSGQFRANFPLGINRDADEVAVVTRRSAALLMFGEGGSLRSQAATCEDADDVFFDERRQRIYVSCGEGVVAVHPDRNDGPTVMVPTASGARTSLFSPELDRLFVAAPARSRSAEILILAPDRE